MSLTLDELKEEAKKHGYKLVKESGYISLLPCPKCGRKSTVEWYHRNDTISRGCDTYGCDFHGKQGKTHREARIKWNEAVQEYIDEHK